MENTSDQKIVKSQETIKKISELLETLHDPNLLMCTVTFTWEETQNKLSQSLFFNGIKNEEETDIKPMMLAGCMMHQLNILSQVQTTISKRAIEELANVATTLSSKQESQADTYDPTPPAVRA